MRHLRLSSLTAAGVAATALALPVAASAHPSVYVTSAPVLSTAMPAPLCSATGATGSYTAAAFLATCVQQTRYVFTNHGNTALLRETNGKTTGGAISYAHRPAGLASASDFDIFSTPAQGPTTGAQVHATCDVATLTTPAMIRSWQGTDPFYAYVPFQRTAAGFDDKAESWLGVVKTATGVDLNLVADTDAAREAACEALPGAAASSYVPADATQSSKASWSSGPVTEAKAPLEATIVTLTSDKATMASELATVKGSLTSAAAEIASVKGSLTNAATEIASLKAALTRLKLTFPAAVPSLDGLAASGMALTLVGPAGRTVNVRLLIPADKLKKAKLKSRIIATHSVALGADGAASLVITPTPTAAAALKEFQGKLSVLGEATTGDRRSLAGAVLQG